MPEFSPFEATIGELQQAMADGDTTALKLTQYYLDRIDKFDQTGPTINAISNLNPEALAVATQRDDQRSQGKLQGSLHGIPVVVKDNYETMEMPTTAGSKLLADFHTYRDATLVSRLKAAGAIILAKTNMHEFAYGITTCGSLFGQTKNPYDLNRNAGGSSGGSAAAIAANFATVGMGSDTCGSIRIPCAHNNLVGLRGTQGLSSRHGIVPLSHTHDIGGPITRSVEDLATVLDVTVGFDTQDLQTAESVGQIPTSYRQALSQATLQNKRIGILNHGVSIDHTDAEVLRVINGAISQISNQAAVIPVDITDLEPLLTESTGGFLVLSEDFKWDIEDYFEGLSQAHINNKEQRQINPPIRSLADVIESGVYHPALTGRLQTSAAAQSRANPAYLAELVRATELRRTLLTAMQQHDLDALLYPSIRRLPVALGELEQPGSNCRYSAKSGLPAISLPAGFSGDVPVGLELLGPAWSEAILLGLAQGIESLLRQRRAPSSTPN